MTLVRYLRYNPWYTLLGGYFLLSILLKATTPVDITVPCIWKSLFHLSCPGCGLTSAAIDILKLDWAAAWDSNPLVYVVLPAIVGLVATDFSAFMKKNRKSRL